ncbi:hypothetical protein [Leadbetterella byssophila]|jgi:hypothetical protein|uniref:hypothetical protein n=1 Tax=Leadbetterella byssophila TaxID=316068 RepID=UPI00030AB53D|nr:hypothetical protein [Leadbetterella byssophila]
MLEIDVPAKTLNDVVAVPVFDSVTDASFPDQLFDVFAVNTGYSGSFMVDFFENGK